MSIPSLAPTRSPARKALHDDQQPFKVVAPSLQPGGLGALPVIDPLPVAKDQDRRTCDAATMRATRQLAQQLGHALSRPPGPNESADWASSMQLSRHRM